MNKQDALSKFIADKTCNYCPETMKYLEVPIQHFFGFNPEIQDVESYRTEHLGNWIEHLHESGLKSTTINQYPLIYSRYSRIQSNLI